MLCLDQSAFMYAQHFGLSQDPFSIAPDPRYLFMSERHREALAHLLYGVSARSSQGAASGTGGGFVLLTGDIGTGKTTICRCFLEQIPDFCHVAYIFNPKLSVLDLLQTICEEFHLTLTETALRQPTVKNYIDALNVFLLQAHADGQTCVLIIDEAQNLAPDVLEQLRLLTNLETRERKLLQIVLIGQPELRTMLARPELEQLAQRVIARFHLDALSFSETTQYISHRLTIAHHTGALPFDRRALRSIYQLTNGVPRRINLLCGRALLGAWATGLHQVTRQVVKKAALEVFGRTTSYRSNWPLTPVQWALVAPIFVAIMVGIGMMSIRFFPATSVTQHPVSPVAAARLAPAVKFDHLQIMLKKMPTDINMAWRELAVVWQLRVVPSGDPCQNISNPQIQCYRLKKLSVPLLRQLDRPGILTLQTGTGAPVYAVLTALSNQTATLKMQGLAYSIQLLTLTERWHGDFATYWQMPAGYQANLRDGSVGPAIDWLHQHLSQIEGIASMQTPASSPVTLDGTLRKRVRSFQALRGITADGQPGPMTLMQMESALGINSPQLHPVLPPS